MIEPHFDIDFTRGMVGENLAKTVLGKLQGNKIEVKTDYRIPETGNIYIETWQYHREDESDIKQSGINVTESEYWCIASPTGRGFIMVETEMLREIIRETSPREVRQSRINFNTNASKGRLIKVSEILRRLELRKSD
jgi:hypothetical protein